MRYGIRLRALESALGGYDFKTTLHAFLVTGDLPADKLAAGAMVTVVRSMVGIALANGTLADDVAQQQLALLDHCGDGDANARADLQRMVLARTAVMNPEAPWITGPLLDSSRRSGARVRG